MVLAPLLTIAIGGAQEALEINFDLIALPQLAPGLAFLILAMFFRDLKFKLNLDADSRTALQSLKALVLPFALFTLIFWGMKLFGVKISANSDLSPLLGYPLVGMLIGAVGEEAGWRSFLQPLLENKIKPLYASLITGILWGAWHIGNYQNGWIFMAGFMVMIISASIILAMMLRRTGFSIYVSSLFHLSINLGFYIWFKNTLDEPKTMLIVGATWAVLAIIVVIVTGTSLEKNR